MMHIPLRGLFLLSRTAVLVVAAAAAPVIIKQSKPLARRVGEELEKLGKWLKDDAPSEPPRDASANPPKAAQAAKPKASKEPAAKTRAAKPQAKRTSVRTKPKPKTDSAG